MTDVFDIVAEQTGLDLRDHKLTEKVIAPGSAPRRQAPIATSSAS